MVLTYLQTIISFCYTARICMQTDEMTQTSWCGNSMLIVWKLIQAFLHYQPNLT